jgi:hypothetical protein
VNRGQRLAVEEHRGRDNSALCLAFRLTLKARGLGARLAEEAIPAPTAGEIQADRTDWTQIRLLGGQPGRRPPLIQLLEA